MSVSKWKWTPECDRGICVGDCDLCDKAKPEFGEWVPIKTRLMTEKERKELDEVCDWIDWASDEAIMFDCKMPEDDQTVLICTESGYIFLDTCINDDYGYGLEERDDWDGVVAWMPLPEPYGGAK